MTQKRNYDCIVIGGGHNGLITAAYLAKQGHRVCVLERRHVLGGCATTEELWPGYRVSTAAYVISLLLPEIIRDLQLKQNGLRILPRNPSSFTPLLDGRSLLMGPDKKATCAEIAKFSQRDAEQYPKYEALLEKVAAVLEPTLSRPAPNPLPLPKSWRRQGVGKRVRDMSQLWDIYQAMGDLGETLPEAVELLSGAARPILERWFEAEVLRATLATDAIIGAFESISAASTGYVLLHHVMGEAGGARGVWGYVEGGMGGLADALERVLNQLGVDIYREAAVQRILVDIPRRHLSHQLRIGQRKDQPGPFRAAEFYRAALRQSGAPSPRNDAHLSNAGLYRTRLRRRPSRAAQRRTRAGDDDGVERRSVGRARRQTCDVHLRPIRAVRTGRRRLGRHQGIVRRSLHRTVGPLRSQSAWRHRTPPSAESFGS